MAGEDPHYLAWLGTQPCAVPDCGRQSAPPHHPRHSVGMSQRAHDHRAVPLCHEHHDSVQTYALMPKLQLRDWLDVVAARCRTNYLNIDQRRMLCE